MKTRWYVTITLVLMATLLTGCGPLGRLVRGTETPTPAFGTYAAPVQGVQVEVREGDPPQVSAVLRVMFAETCAQVGGTQVQYSDRTFRITVYARTPIDHGCAPALAPVEVGVPLDVRGLPAGDYAVAAGDVRAVFTLK